MSDTWDEGEPVLDLRAMSGRLWAHRWLMAVCIIGFGALFTTAAFVMTPVYRSTTMVISTSMEQNRLSGSLGSVLAQVGGLASLAGVNVGATDTAMQEALAVLSSRQFTEKFISDLHLMPELFPKQWDAATGRWKGPVDQQPTPERAFEYFDRSIRDVGQDKKTGLITVQIDWRNRQEAAAWANELVRRVNEEMRDRAIKEADASLAFLDKEARSASFLETQSAINRLIEAQIQKRMLADVTDEYAFRIVDRALPSDPDSPQRPNKVLMIGGGPLVGFAIGAFWVLFCQRRPKKRASEPS